MSIPGIINDPTERIRIKVQSGNGAIHDPFLLSLQKQCKVKVVRRTRDPTHHFPQSNHPKDDTDMICQIASMINTLRTIIWDISLKDLYDKSSGAIRCRKARFFMPGSKRYCKARGYVLNGGYVRRKVIDKQRVLNSDGSYSYITVEVRDFRIQRILERGSSSASHAILPEIFVPYKQYSLRFILFHIRGFFMSKLSQEQYCLNENIEIKTFRHWLKWLKDHITVLADMGLVQDYRENWEIMRRFVQRMNEDISGWTAKSLKRMNLFLFQDCPMPENTAYQTYEKTG